jgi:hypothetical protein
VSFHAAAISPGVLSSDFETGKGATRICATLLHKNPLLMYKYTASICQICIVKDFLEPRQGYTYGAERKYSELWPLLRLQEKGALTKRAPRESHTRRA